MTTISSTEQMRKQGIELFVSDELTPVWQCDEAHRKLKTLIAQRPKSILVELNTYRKYVPIILKLVEDLSDITNSACKHMERMQSGSTDKLYQRWSPEEDEALIEMACRDDMSILKISTTLGRTVPSIKTRLSTLVGRKRMSQKVAGKFIGFIDGVETEGRIAGAIYKTEEKDAI